MQSDAFSYEWMFGMNRRTVLLLTFIIRQQTAGQENNFQPLYQTAGATFKSKCQRGSLDLLKQSPQITPRTEAPRCRATASLFKPPRRVTGGKKNAQVTSSNHGADASRGVGEHSQHALGARRHGALFMESMRLLFLNKGFVYCSKLVHEFKCNNNTFFFIHLQ